MKVFMSDIASWELEAVKRLRLKYRAQPRH
jgi:hypothetical protein